MVAVNVRSAFLLRCVGLQFALLQYPELRRYRDLLRAIGLSPRR